MDIPSDCRRACASSQDACFDIVFDDAIKTGVRASKSAEDIVELGSLKEAIDKLRVMKSSAASASEDPAGQGRLLPGSGGPDASGGIDGTINGAPTASIDILPCVLDFATELSQSLGGKELDSEDLEFINRYGMKARRALWSNVTLIVLQASEKKMADIMRASPACQGEATSYTGVLYDAKLFGAPITAPHIRIPTLNTDCLKA